MEATGRLLKGSARRGDTEDSSAYLATIGGDWSGSDELSGGVAKAFLTVQLGIHLIMGDTSRRGIESRQVCLA
jgi:hypothetical protein